MAQRESFLQAFLVSVGIRFEGFYKVKIKDDKLNDNEQRGFILYSKLTESSNFLNYATIYIITKDLLMT